MKKEESGQLLVLIWRTEYTEESYIQTGRGYRFRTSLKTKMMHSL